MCRVAGLGASGGGALEKKKVGPNIHVGKGEVETQELDI